MNSIFFQEMNQGVIDHDVQEDVRVLAKILIEKYNAVSSVRSHCVRFRYNQMQTDYSIFNICFFFRVKLKPVQLNFLFHVNTEILLSLLIESGLM